MHSFSSLSLVVEYPGSIKRTGPLKVPLHADVVSVPLLWPFVHFVPGLRSVGFGFCLTVVKDQVDQTRLGLELCYSCIRVYRYEAARGKLADTDLFLRPRVF